MVGAEAFSVPGLGHIYHAALRLYEQGVTPDSILVAAELKRLELLEVSGGVARLSELIKFGVGATKAEQYARMVSDRYEEFRILMAADAITAAALEGNRDALGRALAELDQARTAGPTDRFRRYAVSELVQMERTFRWLVRGLLARPTYAQLAGEMKTLKSHLSLMLSIAVASGMAVLGRFRVDDPGPVLIYVGEGGREPYTRLLERIAAAMGVELGALPLEVSFDVASIGSRRFRESLRADLRDLSPPLFCLDPYYAYHGTDTTASDLHQEGALLVGLSSLCLDAGTSPLVVNHYNQTGNGGGLKRITQAGSGEWADSWLLTSHREPPDVANGRFRLILEAGSRQWGGSSWDVDLDVGRFDEEREIHDGPISWSICRHEDGAGDPAHRVVEVVRDHPLEMTKEELAKCLGGNLQHCRRAVATAEERGLIVPELTPRKRSDGRQYRVWVFRVPSEVGRNETEEEF
jgi:hypothetical protein